MHFNKVTPSELKTGRMPSRMLKQTNYDRPKRYDWTDGEFFGDFDQPFRLRWWRAKSKNVAGKIPLSVVQFVSRHR